MERPKVVVAYPTHDLVHASFTNCLVGLLCEDENPKAPVNARGFSLVPKARNFCVSASMQSGADYLFFIDSDMTFPATALQRLLDHGKDIVGATYVQRNAPHALLGVKVTGAPLGIKRPPEGKTWSGPPLIEALCLPTGCLLIKMNVFSKLRRPYFHLRVDEGLGVEIGEDIVFCEKARKEGFQVWCDPALSLELGHVGQSVFFIP